MATAATPAGDAMILNFCTPHASIYANKVYNIENNNYNYYYSCLK